MTVNSVNNKRIAKNTLLLYFRMLFTMAISLYTSRVVLEVLGVEDYGVYNVVGSFVAMFSVISGSLTAAVSRFITFEIGRGDKEKLLRVFSTSVNIQIVMSLVIVLISELIGLWFLNFEMNLPDNRIYAANWVLQCSIIGFVLNLINVPYNAEIIAHEKMSVYAYMSIFDVAMKLCVAYLLLISSFDKLIVYALLLMVLSLVNRIIYGLYCKVHFEEATYHFIWDKRIFKEMLSFAGWNFFGNTTYMLNTQGVNMLINIFFGVTMNAARGIAVQVDNAIMGFVNNFTMAIQPQITKSYASGDLDGVYLLTMRGFKFSAYITYFFAIPFLLEAETILNIWLKNPPVHSVVFLQAVIIASFIGSIGSSLYHAIIASGKIKGYQIQVTILGTLVFWGTWIAYALGASAVSTYLIYAGVYIMIIFLRLYSLKGLMNYPVKQFIINALFPVILVGCGAFLIPYIVMSSLDQSVLRLILTIVLSIISTSLFAYILGLTKSERHFINEKIKTVFSRFLH